MLSNISFYRLRAYTYPFQDNRDCNHPFTYEISFEEIIDIYIFDRKLRLLVFDAIEKIEISLRTKIIYNISLDKGSHWFQKQDCFNNQKIFKKDLASLKRELRRSTETFIKHYNKIYDKPKLPPAWMSLEVSSLGLLSSLYSNLKNTEAKKEIARGFGISNTKLLASWIHALASTRNICAHHSRLWNRRLTINPQIPKNTIYNFLKDRNIKSNKIYIQLAIINYILKIISPDSDFSEKLKGLFNKYTVIDEKEMGFPENWHKEGLWN